jgi:hypothetical protein
MGEVYFRNPSLPMSSRMRLHKKSNQPKSALRPLSFEGAAHPCKEQLHNEVFQHISSQIH